MQMSNVNSGPWDPSGYGKIFLALHKRKGSNPVLLTMLISV